MEEMNAVQDEVDLSAEIAALEDEGKEQSVDSLADLEVLYDKLLVSRLEETSDSPIAIPDSAKEAPLVGIVIRVGEGRFSPAGPIPLRVRVGDKVWFGEYSGKNLTVGRQTVTILREDEVLLLERRQCG